METVKIVRSVTMHFTDGRDPETRPLIVGFVGHSCAYDFTDAQWDELFEQATQDGPKMPLMPSTPYSMTVDSKRFDGVVKHEFDCIEVAPDKARLLFQRNRELQAQVDALHHEINEV
jgi:hypothetical protein